MAGVQVSSKLLQPTGEQIAEAFNQALITNPVIHHCKAAAALQGIELVWPMLKQMMLGSSMLFSIDLLHYSFSIKNCLCGFSPPDPCSFCTSMPAGLAEQRS